MDLNLLKVDLDIKNYHDAINHLSNTLAYMHDLDFFHFDKNIEKIVFIKKNNYSAKIYLRNSFNSEKDIVIFQLLLGSDVMKEINTLINHYKLNMDYSNRMFEVKRYKGGKIKTAKIKEVTQIIRNKVFCEDRRKYKN